MYVSVIDSPLGRLEMHTDDRALLTLLPAEEDVPLSPPADAVGIAAAAQLAEYCAGTRLRFDIPLAPAGTEFQRKIWRVLREIPFGETRTYGELAVAAGCPGGARAVGSAVGANPILILIPCHRVVASDGIGGFSAGLWRKRILLTWEGVLIP